MIRWRRFNTYGPVLCLALLAPALLTPTAASAATGVVDWPTYLRAGPGRQFTVIQELARGAILERGDCTAQWCAVRVDRVAGYVDRASLGDQSSISTPAVPTTPSGCFASERTGYGNGEPFRYCPR